MTVNEFIEKVECGLQSALSDCGGLTGEAMKYAVTGGGKRVRPMCVYYGATAVAGDADVLRSEDLPLLAEVVELIHSYSLVHDDMPEMDNDDYRRGKLSVHKKFGAATALLVGDALLTLASSLLLKCKNREAAAVISDAALDMVFGQSAELAGCKSEKEYLEMYSKKTGALIRGAFVAGVICACAGENYEAKIAYASEFAERLGLAFQLADDLLDGDGIAALIGKARTREMLDRETSAAIDVAKKLGNCDELIGFAERLWRRER